MEEKKITFDDIQNANKTIKTTDVKGKEYAEVNQRIKAYRMVYPTGAIKTEMISNENGVCIFKATVTDEDDNVLGTGTAYEKEGSTFINKTSYIENCETSAVGRALGMAGFGIDTSVASAEEVQNAMANQKKEEPKTEAPTEPPQNVIQKATPVQVATLLQVYTGDNLAKLLETNNIKKIEDMSLEKASQLIKKIKEKGNK